MTKIAALGIIDSLGILQLTAFMEENFGIRIGPGRRFCWENFRDIGSLSSFVEQKQGRR